MYVGYVHYGCFPTCLKLLRFVVQVRDKLPHLKAIVQYTREVTETDDNVWDVSHVI